MDSTDSELCGCESSNFIPSSESDPPPPVSYHVAECKPGDIRTQECDVNTENQPAFDVSDTMVSADCSFESSNTAQNQRSLTQADDFRDLSKENSDPSEFKSLNCSPISNSLTPDSCNSPFLSGFESRSSSLARLPNSASILNSSEGGGDEGDLSVMHDHENSSPTESDSLMKNKDVQLIAKKTSELVENEVTESVESILAVSLSAVVYRMDNTNEVVFDNRFNVKIQAKSTSDSILSTSPPTTDSSNANVLSSKSLFGSTSISVSNSYSIQRKVDDNHCSDNHGLFKSPGCTSSSGSELFIPRPKNKLSVEEFVGDKCPVRASTTSSSSSDLFIPRSANKRIRELKDKQGCESSTTLNAAQKSAESNLLRLSLLPSSFSSNNKSAHDFTHRSSLTLVSETPSEDTTNESFHYPNTETNQFVKQTDTELISDSASAITLTTKTAITETEDITLTLSESTPGEQWVYGKWKTEKNYYAGKIYPNESGSRCFVIFEDGTRARIKQSDLVAVYLLPVGAELSSAFDLAISFRLFFMGVSAELKDDNEYWGDCVIQAHSSDSERPYKVFCRTTNEAYFLRRGQVSIHESEVDNLKKRQLLPSNPFEIQISIENENKINMNTSITKICASPEVSLSNLVFDKRKSRPKVYRSSWITPIKQLTTVKKDTDDQHCITLPSKLTLSSHLRKRYRNHFKRKLQTPSVRINRSRNRSDSSTGRSSSAKKQRLSDLFSDDENLLTQPMSLQTPVSKTETSYKKNNSSQIVSKRMRSSPSPKSRASIGLLRSLSHNLDIPIPSPTVFHGWTIILTGGAKNYNSNESIDRNLLEQLIIACGGEVALEINPSLLNRSYGWESPELDDSFHQKKSQCAHFVALVSTDCCRTLKYFQALATLGSVPLLRIDWLLDSCREDAKTYNNQSSFEETRNWPLYLLRTYPGRYELPRGFISGSSEPVSWWSVPVRYRSPAYQTIPSPSLFGHLGDWADCGTNYRLVAIVTNDLKVFGPGWLNILSLACGSNNGFDELGNSSNRIPLIHLSEISQKLSDLFPSVRCRSKASEKKVNFVLVDKNHINQSAFAFMKTLPIEMVTCDYFIHSLICGHLVNPKSSPYFSPIFYNPVTMMIFSCAV
uniref:BRCT domain-containing protein n=1 Tax=Schistosoma haematobium TaxID=6185 RepID=A0A094ZQ38_SCHHA